MRHSTVLQSPPQSTARLTFDLQRFAEVNYIGADGNTCTADATVFDGQTSLNSGNYIVQGTVTINSPLDISGDVNLILADGAQLNITSNGWGINVNSDASLNIYAQSAGTGKLDVTSNGYGINNYYGTVNIYGGQVSAAGNAQGINNTYGTFNIYGGQVTAKGGTFTGINNAYGAFNIYGGQVTATSDVYGIYNSGTFTLGWTAATDFINANSYLGNITIADGKRFYDAAGNAYGAGSAPPSGKLNALDGFIVTAPDGLSVDGATRIGDTNKYICAGNDATISAILAAGHYVFGNATDGYTLATEANTKDYPDLVQVYELNLPDNVTVEGATVVTDNGKTYAAGEVTLEAADGYTLANITVNGASDEDGVFTINSDTKILANIVKFNSAGTGVTVKSTKGDFHAYSGVYSITASQENSTLIGNAKANTILVAGGGENILTGGTGNDTFKFSAGGGIVTDYGIGATKNGDGTAATANGVDVVKVSGKVKGIYFERDASTKKEATFTATIVYGNDEVIVLKDIVKKPTKTGSSPIYQTNDVAAATLKIWDTSSGKQSVLSASKLKKLFIDDDSSAFTEILQEKRDYLVKISDGDNPATNPFDVTPAPSDGDEISGVEGD